MPVPLWRRTGGPCACGCGRPRLQKCRYATRACMPHEERVRLASQSRLASAWRARALRFKADLDRLERKVTREDLMALLYTVYRRGYHAGRSQGVRERARKVAA